MKSAPAFYQFCWVVVSVLSTLTSIATVSAQNNGSSVLTSILTSGKEALEVGTFAGSGYSSKPDVDSAVEAAISQAKNQLNGNDPTFAIVFDGNGRSTRQVAFKARQILGESTRIWGSRSGSGVSFSDKALASVTPIGTSQVNAKVQTSAENQAVSVLLVASNEIELGVATANTDDFPSAELAAQSAIVKAIAKAKPRRNQPPSAVIVSPQFGRESEMLAGIESVIGKDVPVLGGTNFGSFSAHLSESVDYTTAGISLAVIYTDLPLGWTFEAGFRVRDPVSAVITKLDGTKILELDNRPAFEVYDEWFGGKMRELCEANDKAKIRELRNLNPICKRIESKDKQAYYNYTITYPNLEDLSVEVKIDVQVGDRMYLSEGNWERLMNRVCSLPKNAKSRAGIDSDMKVLFGVGFYCGGVMDLIPNSEMTKIPKLVRNANNRSPFVSCVTAGEQGYFPGLGARHGHLSTSFLLIGKNTKPQ